MKRSDGFWKAIAFVCVAFAAYELLINLQLRAVNDDVVESCAPAPVLGDGVTLAAR